jgi:potassium voltage-gated channel Shal-related subfamily D protein 2
LIVEEPRLNDRGSSSSTIEVMYIAVHRSKDALFALSFFLVMAIVIFSTLIYFVERGVWDNNLGTFVTADGEQGLRVFSESQADRVLRLSGDPSEFESIPSAAWFVLVSESQWEAALTESTR